MRFPHTQLTTQLPRRLPALIADGMTSRPWWTLELKRPVHTKDGDLVGLRIARTVHTHELVVLYEKRPELPSRAPSEASYDRVQLAQLSVKEQSAGLHLSATGRAGIAPLSLMVRPDLVEGGIDALCEFATALRRHADGSRAEPGHSADEAPLAEAIVKSHQEAVRKPAAPRRSLPTGLGGYKARSTLRGTANASGSPMLPTSIGAAAFYRKPMSALWGNKVESSGARQLAATSAAAGPSPGRMAHHTSVPARAAGSPSASLTAAASAPYGGGARSSPHRPSHPLASVGAGSARERALLGSSVSPGRRPVGGPKFGDDDDDAPLAPRRISALEMMGRPAKQPRVASSAPAHHHHPLPRPYPLHSHHASHPLATSHAGGHALASGGGGGGGGFRNIGNTCYINAVLSSLLGLAPFVADVLALIPLFAPRLGQETLYSALSSLMHQRYALGDERPATPRRLKDAIAKRSAQFAGFAQQDAHEFLADCLDGLQVP